MPPIECRTNTTTMYFPHTLLTARPPFHQMNWPAISVPTITRRMRKWLYRPLCLLLILFPVSLFASLLSQVGGKGSPGFNQDAPRGGSRGLALAFPGRSAHPSPTLRLSVNVPFLPLDRAAGWSDVTHLTHRDLAQLLSSPTPFTAQLEGAMCPTGNSVSFLGYLSRRFNPNYETSPENTPTSDPPVWPAFCDPGIGKQAA